MEAITSLRPLIKKELTAALRSIGGKRNAVNRWVPDTAARLMRFIAGGKLLRGSFVVFAYRASGGTSDRQAIRAGAAIELIHAGLLIHDDIMDNDTLRRGQRSLFDQYNREFSPGIGGSPDFGKSMAICAGDAAYFAAMSMLGKVAQSHPQPIPPAVLVGDEIRNVCFAQMDDVFLAANHTRPTQKRVVSLYTYKTARYTFSLPLMLGSQLAGADPKTIGLYKSLGEHLGIVFQLRDDRLSIFGNEAQTGKSAGSDIRENKKTMYYFYLAKRARGADTRIVNKAFGNRRLTATDLAYVKKLITKYNVDMAVEALAKRHHAKSLAIIARMPLQDEFKSALRSLAEYNLGRTA